MNIIVCVKPVLEPDLPPIKFNISEKTNSVVAPEGIPPVINPYDALAVEAALRLKEKKGGKIIAVCIGEKSGEDVLRKAMAMGADEAMIIAPESLKEYDGFTKAALLAQAIKKIGAYDLVLCGRQSADWDLGITGSILAEYLDIPVVTRAKAIEAADSGLTVERVSANGNETYSLEMPALVSLSSEMGQARIPSGWGIVAAARKPITKWSHSDLGGSDKAADRNPLLKLSVSSNERTCEFVKGESVAEAAAKLAGIIADLGK